MNEHRAGRSVDNYLGIPALRLPGPSPPAYSSSVPPGQVRLIAPSTITNPSNDFEISEGFEGLVAHQAEDVTGRPESSSSSTDGCEKEPEHSLRIGDQKRLYVVITSPLGPNLPPWDKYGQGRPRFIKVNQRGQEISGHIDVGKMEGCVRLEVSLIGRLTSTSYYGGQPRMTDSRKFLRRTQVIYPNDGRPLAQGEAFPQKSRHPFKFKMPLYTDTDDGDEIGHSSDEEEHENGHHERDANVNSLGTDAVVQAATTTSPISMPKRLSFGRKSTNESDSPAMGSVKQGRRQSSFGFSKSPNTDTITGTPPFKLGSLLHRFSSREQTVDTSPHIHPLDPPREGPHLIRGQSRTSDMQARKGKEPLMPTLNIMIGDVQGEVVYELKVRLVRKGLRLNEV